MNDPNLGEQRDLAGIVVRERDEPWDLEGSREQLGADAEYAGKSAFPCF